VPVFTVLTEAQLRASPQDAPEVEPSWPICARPAGIILLGMGPTTHTLRGGRESCRQSPPGFCGLPSIFESPNHRFELCPSGAGDFADNQGCHLPAAVIRATGSSPVRAEHEFELRA